MKKYQKAQMIAKNLPTGSYAAGCPEHTAYSNHGAHGPGWSDYGPGGCRKCELSA